MSFSGSLSRSRGGLSFAFVTGFVAKTQAPPLLLGLWASLHRPNQRETIAMGDCYILCGRSGVPGPLALILARLLLRGCCPSVPRSFPPVLCSGEAGPGLTRACSPGHFTAYDLETGPWALLPRSCSYHPLPSHGMSRLGVRVCLYILKCCLYYFLEILGFISSESVVPS